MIDWSLMLRATTEWLRLALRYGVLLLLLAATGCAALRVSVRRPPSSCPGSVGLNHALYPPTVTDELQDCRLCDSASACVAPGNFYCVSHVDYFDGRCSASPVNWQGRRW